MNVFASAIFCVLCVSSLAQRPDAGIEQQVFIPTARTVTMPVYPPRPSTEFVPFPGNLFLIPVEKDTIIPSLAQFMVPVYVENCTLPYEVIGAVVVRNIDGPAIGTEADHELALRSAASTAWLHGADALLLHHIIPWRSDYYMAGTAVRWSWRL